MTLQTESQMSLKTFKQWSETQQVVADSRGKRSFVAACFWSLGVCDSSTVSPFIKSERHTHSEWEAKSVLLDQWGLCSSRPAAPLTSLSSPCPSSTCCFCYFLPQELGQATKQAFERFQSWIPYLQNVGKTEGWQERSMGVRKGGMKNVHSLVPGTMDHVSLTSWVPDCKTSHRSLWKADLHLVILK